jgi:hypothetical protein
MVALKKAESGLLNARQQESSRLVTVLLKAAENTVGRVVIVNFGMMNGSERFPI